MTINDQMTNYVPLTMNEVKNSDKPPGRVFRLGEYK
jgi:hypothetical protein